MIQVNASKSGTCPRCHRDITVGDVICKVQGTWTCYPCAEDLDQNPEVGEVEQGVLNDLLKLPDEAAGSSIAKSSLYAARLLDRGIAGARDAGTLIKELRQNRAALMDLYPPDDPDNPADTARKNREAQVGGQWEEPWTG